MRNVQEIRLAVEGIEATQATQFYKSSRHLDAASAAPDNAVPLVAGKPLVVRVYPDVHSSSPVPDSLSVSGQLAFCAAGANEWTASSQFGGSVPGQPAESIDRGDWRQSLNFRIPAKCTHQPLWVRTRVWCDLSDSDRRFSQWYEEELAFAEVPPLRLQIYGIRLVGDGVRVEPPSAAEALLTLSYLNKTFPIPTTEMIGYQVVEFSGDIGHSNSRDGGRGWSELLLLLSRLRIASLSDAAHYALLPAEVPRRGFGGFGSSLGVGVSFAGKGSAMAQELGHVLQLRHAPGQGMGNTDPNYPAYGNYDIASIGEYGCDVVTGKIYVPKSSCDFMGNGNDYWVSPYTYSTLFRLLQEQSADSCANDDDARLYFHLGFHITEDHRCELESGLVLPGPPITAGGNATSHWLELRDQDDRVIFRSAIRCRRRGARDAHVRQSVPFSPEARRLVICCCGHSPTVLEIPQQKLHVELESPCISKAGQLCEGLFEMRWAIDCQQVRALAFFLRYTNDGGKHWQPVSPGFEWNHCRVNLGDLPGGENCRFQLIASTYLQTAVAETVSFRVREKPRVASIAAPATHRSIDCGAVVELFGAAHSPNGFADESDLTWASNLQGYLGRGSHFSSDDLVPGLHEIKLTAPDSLGGMTTSKTLIQIHAPTATQ